MTGVGILAASGRRRSGLIVPATVTGWTFNSTTTGQPSCTCTVPGGTGKLFMFAYANSQTAEFSTAVSGWVTATSADGTAAIDNTVRSEKIFAHPGDGSEGAAGSTFTVTRTVNTSAIMGVILVRLSGAGTLQSIRLASGAGSTTINLGSRPSVAANTLALQLVGYGTAGTGDWTEPVGTTNHGEGYSPGNVRQAVGSDVVGIGDSGDRTWTRPASGASRGSMLLVNAA